MGSEPGGFCGPGLGGAAPSQTFHWPAQRFMAVADCERDSATNLAEFP